MASDARFAGFSRDAIQFMRDLADNNDRAWFQPRKADYERLLKEPMEQLCVALAQRFEARGIPLHADPKSSPFRIYRDTRFSGDKSPYKTHLAATFPWIDVASAGPGDRAHGNGGYFNFQPGDMYVGGGMWQPDRPRQDAFRDAVRDDPERVEQALHDPDFVAWFGGAHGHEELKRVPVGYPADHRLADMFRWKGIVFGKRLTDRQVCSPKLPDLLADGYAAAVPVFGFLATL